MEKNIIVFIFIVFLSTIAFGWRFEVERKDKLVYSFDLLPSSDFKSVSSALDLAYYINPRAAIDINYLSLGNPLLCGSSYTVSYHLSYGLEKWWNIWPAVVGGYRFIYTPETDFVTPIDLGMIFDLPVNDTLNLHVPAVITLFNKDNLIDYSVTVEKQWGWGYLMFGMRSLQPTGASQFVARTLLFFGITNQL